MDTCVIMRSQLFHSSESIVMRICIYFIYTYFEGINDQNHTRKKMLNVKKSIHFTRNILFGEFSVAHIELCIMYLSISKHLRRLNLSFIQDHTDVMNRFCNRNSTAILVYLFTGTDMLTVSLFSCLNALLVFIFIFSSRLLLLFMYFSKYYWNYSK